MDPPGVAMVLPALLSSGVHVSLTRLPLMEYPGQDTLQLGDCPRTPSAMSLTDTPSGASPISSALSEPGCSAEDPVNNSIIAEDISATTLKTPTTKRKCGRPPKVLRMNCLASPAVPIPVPMPPCLPAAASIHTPPAKVPNKRGRKSKAELLMIRLAQEAQAPESPSIQQERDSENEEPEVTPGGRPRRRAAKTARLFLQGVAEDWLTSDLSFLGEPEEASEETTESSTTRRRIRRKGCSTENSVNNSIITEDNSTTTLKTPTPKWKCGRPPKVQRMNCLPSPAVPVSVPMLPCLPAAASIHTPPAKVPNKRGRKSKAELLMITLAQEAQAPESPSIQQERDSENEEPEVTPGGRPRRRAAKTAIRYLQDLAEELSSPGRLSSPQGAAEGTPERSGKKKRRKRFHDDTEDDSDFVVSEAVLREMEKEEMENESDGSDSEMSAGSRECSEFAPKNLPSVRGVAENGFQNTIMAPTWRATQTTNDFRNSWHSNWEFPDWIPSVESWQVLSPREAERYLPMHAVSPPFTIQREGIKQDGVPRTLNRFQSLPSHPDRWDMTFFTGGPVWAMDWCPTPEGSGSCQYLALYCHRGMDDRHRLDKVYSGPALLQLWCLGPLHMEKGAESEASFSYGLAVDQGCMWDMKFCPSGGWELPSTPRKSSQMARLGLLAVAFSSGHVEIYSLPHPECLFSYQKSQVKGHHAQELSVCRVDCVVRLQVGSIKSCTPGENGPCFTLAWLPGKPHQYLAAGFYDGTVSIWDLKTKSVLQRVRQGRVIKQYPFHSFLAHDHAVRSIEWCKADSNFLVTGGNDRRLKFWDFRRLYEPINVLKRFQSTEMSWLLSYCGVVVAQDNCYATHGLCGIHYVDSGFLGYKPYFVASRKGTVWSVSGSDWLSTIAAGDMNGEVIVVVLPNMNANSINTKRPANRRFPIYKTDFLHYAPAPPDSPHSDTELPAGPSANSDWENFKPKSFRAASGQFRLLFQDMDLTHFHSLPTREPVKRMQISENNGDMSMERVRLEAVHKVRFNPNLECFAWVASGGHTGLVRVHCIQGLTSPTGRKLIEEKSAQFRAMYEETDLVREADYSPEVQHCVVQV